ncbi:MAG: hypothetical protein WC565_07195 [Parcubacteria group bacterium]
MYPGTTPNYWLDGHPIEDWYWYLGMAEEEQRRGTQMIGEAVIGTYGAALAKKPLPKSKPLIVSSADEAPDRAAFYKDEYVRKHIKRG